MAALRTRRNDWTKSVEFFAFNRDELLDFCKAAAKRTRTTNIWYDVKEVRVIPHSKKSFAKIELHVMWNGWHTVRFNFAITRNHEVKAEEPSCPGFSSWGRDFVPAIQAWLSVLVTKQNLAHFVTATIKEELMATAWAPARVERLLEAGGWEALDAA